MAKLPESIDITKYALGNSKIIKLYKFYKKRVRENFPELEEEEGAFLIIFQCFINNVIYNVSYMKDIQELVNKALGKTKTISS